WLSAQPKIMAQAVAPQPLQQPELLGGFSLDGICVYRRWSGSEPAQKKVHGPHGPAGARDRDEDTRTVLRGASGVNDVATCGALSVAACRPVESRITSGRKACRKVGGSMIVKCTVSFTPPP